MRVHQGRPVISLGRLLLGLGGDELGPLAKVVFVGGEDIAYLAVDVGSQDLLCSDSQVLQE